MLEVHRYRNWNLLSALLKHEWWWHQQLLGGLRHIAIATGQLNVPTTVGLCTGTASELRLKIKTKFK